MLKNLRTLAVSCVLLGLMACAPQGAGPVDQNETSVDAAIEQSVLALIDETIKANGVAGYSIAIMRNNDVVFETRGGFANVEHNIPISPESRYQIYSASKLFFNVALMQLIEAGDLDPDATLGTYLLDLPDAWAALTVRQVWSHTTGTTDILDLNGMEPTEEEALASVIDIPLTFEPGAETAYNQTNFLLLKMIFERLTGDTYQTYLQESLLAPVGIGPIPMGDLSLVAPNLTTNYEGHAYEVNTLGRRMIKFPPYVYTSAGINITLSEFVTWWQALMNEAFISRETLNEFWQPVLRNDGSVTHRSNGWERVELDDMLRVGHGGGSRIHLFHYIPDATPDQTATVVFLNNGGKTYFDHRGFGDQLAEIVLVPSRLP